MSYGAKRRNSSLVLYRKRSGFVVRLCRATKPDLLSDGGTNPVVAIAPIILQNLRVIET